MELNEFCNFRELKPSESCVVIALIRIQVKLSE
jgi:hypothetical protein